MSPLLALSSLSEGKLSGSFLKRGAERDDGLGRGGSGAFAFFFFCAATVAALSPAAAAIARPRPHLLSPPKRACLARPSQSWMTASPPPPPLPLLPPPPPPFPPPLLLPPLPPAAARLLLPLPPLLLPTPTPISLTGEELRPLPPPPLGRGSIASNPSLLLTGGCCACPCPWCSCCPCCFRICRWRLASRCARHSSS